MNIRVVGLDISIAATGIAIIDGDEITRETVSMTKVSGGQPKPNIVDRALRIWSKVWEFIGEDEIGLVAIEEPIIKPSSIRASRRLIECNFLICSKLLEMDIPVIMPTTNQLKKAATGNGRAEKEEIVSALRDEFDLEIANDAEGDGLACALIALTALKMKHDYERLYIGNERMEKVRREVVKSILSGKNRCFRFNYFVEK